MAGFELCGVPLADEGDAYCANMAVARRCPAHLPELAKVRATLEAMTKERDELRQLIRDVTAFVGYEAYVPDLVKRCEEVGDE